MVAFFLGTLVLPLRDLVSSRSPLASEAVCPPDSEPEDSEGEPASDDEAWKSSSKQTIVSKYTESG